jgi:hypothetical protein
MSRGSRRDAVARRAGLRPATKPLSRLREDPLAARGHRRRDQYRSAGRLVGGAATGQDTDLALCGTGTCTRPVLGAPRRLNRAHTPLPDFFTQCRQYISIFYYRNYSCDTKNREARLGGAFVSYEGLTNSIRPFCAHETRGAIVPGQRAQKLSTEMNVELVVGQEVFGRHADRMVACRLRYECDYFSPPCGTCTVDTHR